MASQVATYHYDIKRVGERASDASEQGGKGLQVRHSGLRHLTNPKTELQAHSS